MPSNAGFHIVLGLLGALANMAALLAPEPYRTIAGGLVAVLAGVGTLVVGHASGGTTSGKSALSVGTKPATVVQFPAPSTQVWQPAPEEDQQGKP